MTRLTYNQSENMLTSKKELLAGDKLVKITLLTDKLIFLVTTIEGDLLFTSEPQASLQMLKKVAKSHLKGMGVQFQDEVRPTKAAGEQS